MVTPVTAPKGGQFVLHAKALHGNPFDGHTLGPIIADLQKQTGVEVQRIHVDKGYRGHNYPNRFKVWISGQVRRVTKTIRREMKRRAAVEPVIGHLKAEHRMGRNHLKGRDGDRSNAVLAAAGFNFHLPGALPDAYATGIQRSLLSNWRQPLGTEASVPQRCAPFIARPSTLSLQETRSRRHGGIYNSIRRPISIKALDGSLNRSIA